jgi:hypothetical protein
MVKIPGLLGGKLAPRNKTISFPSELRWPQARDNDSNDLARAFSKKGLAEMEKGHKTKIWIVK